MKCSKEERIKLTEDAKRLRDKLNLAEKVSLMSGNLTFQDIREHSFSCLGGMYYYKNVFEAGGIPEKGIPAMRFCDGSRGIVAAKNITCFPVTMCRGATFDRELEKKIGRALGREVKACGGNVFAGICINLPYHPGWGRSQETYGEESWHIGEMGSALTEGIQEEQVIACIKHFAFYSMEFSRFKVNISCDLRTEREVFLPHFKKCIDHGAAAVMSAYNSYQGVPCGHSDYLLNQVLKSEWGFDGIVMSDFILGIRDAAEAVNGGMDLEMCVQNLFGAPLLQAVNNGEVKEEKIDEAALRIIRTLLAFEKDKKAITDKNVLGAKEHVALALQAAREGITLIKNDDVLPLCKSKIRRLVVLGKLGQKENVGDRGRVWVNSAYVVTPFQGIANIAPNTEVIYYEGKNLWHAEKLAKSADAVVFVVGYDEEEEGGYGKIPVSSEELTSEVQYPGDRGQSLGLHPDEIELIKTVAPVNHNSIVVLIGGSMIMIEEWKKDVKAILMAYYPGMEGGTAIAEIIFGDVNPSGKLPFVIPEKVEDLPDIQWHTSRQTYGYYHGYAKLEKEGKSPSVPFGYGLSYTKFQLKNEKFEVMEDSVCASCEIENIGQYDGVEVLQMYIGFSKSKVDRPVKLLRGFERVFLKRNERKEIKIMCPFDEIKWYNPKTGNMELEHMEYEIFIGTSSSNEHLLKGKIVL